MTKNQAINKLYELVSRAVANRNQNVMHTLVLPRPSRSLEATVAYREGDTTKTKKISDGLYEIKIGDQLYWCESGWKPDRRGSWHPSWMLFGRSSRYAEWAWISDYQSVEECQEAIQDANNVEVFFQGATYEP